MCVRQDGEESGEGGGKWGGGWKCNRTLSLFSLSLSGGNDNGGEGGWWHNSVSGVGPTIDIPAWGRPRDDDDDSGGGGGAARRHYFRGRRPGWPVNRSVAGGGGGGADGAGEGRGRDPRERYVFLDNDNNYDVLDPFASVCRWGRQC